MRLKTPIAVMSTVRTMQCAGTMQSPTEKIKAPIVRNIKKSMGRKALDDFSRSFFSLFGHVAVSPHICKQGFVVCRFARIIARICASALLTSVCDPSPKMLSLQQSISSTVTPYNLDSIMRFPTSGIPAPNSHRLTALSVTLM